MRQDIVTRQRGWLKKTGAPPFQKLLELGYNLPEEFAVFPPVVLDTFSATWTLEGGNNLLAHYTIGSTECPYYFPAPSSEDTGTDP